MKTIGMTLPFFDKDAEQEYFLRIQRAREPEEKRHKEKESEITSDFSSRGLLHSGMYLNTLKDERILHLRKLICIAREELFGVVDSRGIRLKDRDIKAILGHFAESFKKAGNRLREKHAELEKQLGLPACPVKTFQRQIAGVIKAEAVEEVVLRVSELKQKRKAAKKALWSGRVEKLVWMIIGVLLGVFGTLLSLWLLGTMKRNGS